MITITAVSGESAEGITLEASKNALYPDGGDFAVLTLKDKDGTDVSAQGEFYADGEKLESNRYSTTKGSVVPVTISAKYNGHDVANHVQISAASVYSFTHRLLLEDITRTTCQYCPMVIRVIDELRQDAQPLVVPYSIHNSSSSIYQSYYSSATRQFASAFCNFMGTDYTTAPKVYVDHGKTEENTSYLSANNLRSRATEGPTDVAIALESSVEGSTISVTVTVGSKKNFEGKIVVVLVENGIYAEQQSMGNIEMYRIMRAYAPSVEGEPKSFRTRVPTTYSATFDLNSLRANAQNCEVIAFVTNDETGLSENVQYAKIGEIKGY